MDLQPLRSPSTSIKSNPRYWRLLARAPPIKEYPCGRSTLANPDSGPVIFVSPKTNPATAASIFLLASFLRLTGLVEIGTKLFFQRNSLVKLLPSGRTKNATSGPNLSSLPSERQQSKYGISTPNITASSSGPVSKKQ